MFSRLASQSNSLVTRSLIRQFHVSAMAPVAVGDKVGLRLLLLILTHWIKKINFRFPMLPCLRIPPVVKLASPPSVLERR